VKAERRKPKAKTGKVSYERERRDTVKREQYLAGEVCNNSLFGTG
jgi:hypothetical protein